MAFLSQIFPIYKNQGKRKVVSLTPLYYNLPLHRDLDSSQVITKESSPLPINAGRIKM